MLQSPEDELFRDFGIPPQQGVSPPSRIRAGFSWGRKAGQYLLTVLMAGAGIGLALFCAQTRPFPLNVLGSVASLAGFGYVICVATRYDYAWVELDEDVLRAKHLYTGRVVERSVDEIEDLLTLVFQRQTAATRIADALVGRVRGIGIRFRDQSTPLQISRADPAMSNARELIEAVISRMSEQGEIEAEVIDRDGQPLIRRIHWKEIGGG